MSNGHRTLAEVPVVTQLGISLKLYFDHQTTMLWTASLVDELSRRPQLAGRADIWVAPATPFLADVRDLCAGTRVSIAAQNLDQNGRGAFTGGIAAEDLVEVGCRRVVIGHAERRARGETDDDIAAKLDAAVRAGLEPVVCVGEPVPMPATEAAAHVVAQARAAGRSAPATWTIAYEPVWAIGAQEPASTDHIRAVCSIIRESLPDARVIYGGSARPGLLPALGLSVDGMFLGRFAHDPSSFGPLLSDLEAVAAQAASTAHGSTPETSAELDSDTTGRHAMRDIRVALIGGGGFMGRAHSLGYAVANVLGTTAGHIEKAMLVDVDPDAAAAAAATLGWAGSSTDWRAVVASPEIDVVDIVTPPGLHKEIALEAFRHGKHVFCEKPIANELADAQVMWEAARSAGVTHQVGFNYRHMPAITEARRLMLSGELGRPLQFRGTYLHDALFFISDFGWRGSRATGGSGATGDIGSHLIDLAQYLCGPIARVAALQVARDPDSDATFIDGGALGDRLDDAAVWAAEFTNGAIGTFSAGFISSGKKNSLTFEVDGSRGGLAFDWNNPDELRVSYLDDALTAAAPRLLELTQDRQPEVWYPVPGLGQGYIDAMAIQLNRFLEAAMAGEEGHPGFDEALQVHRVVDAISLSAATGAWVTVPVPAEVSS